MENVLKNLMDYQRFEGNARLAKLIQETENRYCNELNDDDLELVNAAGDINQGNMVKKYGRKNDL